MSNLPQRYPTVYECKIGQGQQGNCFKWALERVLSKIVITTAYPGLFVSKATLKYPNRDWINNPLTDNMLSQLSPQEVEGIRTRIGLTQFFGDWIALYCGSEGDIKEAYLDVLNNNRVTDEHSFPNNNSMCGMTRPQSFANTPEVLMYNFSRIVNYILDDMRNIETHLNLLLNMRYPICLGIIDPTLEDVNDTATHFNGLRSGSKEIGYEYYSYYVRQAFQSFFNVLSRRGAFLDLKTVTLHRKPYVIYKGEQQLLVPQIDISVDNVSETPEKSPNNYFGDIMKEVNDGLYAEVSVYMPKQENSAEYFKQLEMLTEKDSLERKIYENMNLRSGNIGINKIVKTMSSETPGGSDNFSGHSMALKGIRIVNSKGKKQIYITFINSWDNQTYVEYPVNLFFRVDVHALQEVNDNPGHIRDSDVVDIQQKYMEISVYAPSCIPEYMLQMVASGDTSFYRDKKEEADVYRVKLANHQDGWGIQSISPIQASLGSPNGLDETIMDEYISPSAFSQDESSQDESQIKRTKNCKYNQITSKKLEFEDVTPMEVCNPKEPEKCSNLPVLETVSKKRTRDEGNQLDKAIRPKNAWSGGNKGGKPKTNKRRAKPRKRVTRKLKKKRATYRVKPCRILKRRTYKRK